MCFVRKHPMNFTYSRPNFSYFHQDTKFIYYKPIEVKVQVILIYIRAVVTFERNILLSGFDGDCQSLSLIPYWCSDSLFITFSWHQLLTSNSIQLMLATTILVWVGHPVHLGAQWMGKCGHPQPPSGISAQELVYGGLVEVSCVEPPKHAQIASVCEDWYDLSETLRNSIERLIIMKHGWSTLPLSTT